MSSSIFLREALAVLTAAGVVLDAALVEVAVVTEAASVGAVEVDLEAGMASTVDGSVKVASEHVVVVTLKAGFENKAPALGVWSVNESDLYQGVSLAGVEHLRERAESCLGPPVTGIGGETCCSARARWSCFFLTSERVDMIASIFFPMVTARL